MSNSQQLRNTINSHPEELHVMSLDDFREIAQKMRNTVSDGINADTAASLASPSRMFC